MRRLVPPTILALGSLALLPGCSLFGIAANQLTVVQGTVTSYDTGQPLPGVLMAIDSYEPGLFTGPLDERLTGDSVRTDAQGHYQLSFRNQTRRIYNVVIEPVSFNLPFRVPRLGFYANQAVAQMGGAGSVNVTIGRPNVVDFQPNVLRTIAVRIRNHNTGYQRLDLWGRYLRGNNLDTTALLLGYYLPPAGARFHYYRLSAAGALLQDTLVALQARNPAALPPDTVHATLTFVR